MTQDMTRGTPWRLILFFSIPLIVGNIFQQLYSMADTIIVGRFVSVEALAAVGSTGAIFFLVIGFVQGITSGFAVVTSQRFGAGDLEGVKRSIGTCTVLCVLTTLILTSISVLTARPLLDLMNTPDNIMEDAHLYIVIIYAGIGATVYYNMISGLLRALGDSKTPLYFLLLSAGLNVVLDLVTIINFGMGVAGAAYATVVSQLVSAVFCTIFAVWKNELFRLKRDDFRWEWHQVKTHLQIGLPMALQFSVTAIGVMVMQGALNKFGSTVIASYTAASKVENLVMQPMVAFGITMATYCGQNLGAGRMDRIRKGVWNCTVMGLMFCILASLINVFFGEAFTNLFLNEKNPEVIDYAMRYLKLVAVFYPVLGMIFIYRNALQGMGMGFAPMMGGVAELIARFAVCMLLPGKLGYLGVCLASPVAWIAADIPLFTKYFTFMHQQKKQEAA